MVQTDRQRETAHRAVGFVRQALAPVSLGQWARRHGYLPATVSVVLHRWAWRPDVAPHGGMARQIMARLWADHPRLRGSLRRALAEASTTAHNEAA